MLFAERKQGMSCHTATADLFVLQSSFSMADSCGAPVDGDDALMTRKYNITTSIVTQLTRSGRKTYDRGKTCVKCKERVGALVVRHAVYCK